MHDSLFDVFFLICFLLQATTKLDLNPFDGSAFTRESLNSTKLPRGVEVWDRFACGSETTTYVVTNVAEQFFTWLFFLEAFVKIVTWGFFYEENSYLRDPWNWLDFVVVVVSLLGYLPSISNFSVFRTFRVLRPLRALTRMPGMRIIISAIFNSVYGLSFVMLLALFFFALFGIIGIQFFAGLFDARCHVKAYQDAAGVWVSTNNASLFTVDELDDRLCGLRSSTAANCDEDLGFTSCIAGIAGRTCGDVQWFDGENTVRTFKRVCKRVSPEEGPNYGNTDFDNIGAAALTIYTSITLEVQTRFSFLFLFYLVSLTLCISLCIFVFVLFRLYLHRDFISPFP